MKNIVASIVIGLCIGTFAEYLIITHHDDGRIKQLESKIDTLTKDLDAEQQKALDALSRLQAIEDQKKKIDLKIRGDFDELQKSNNEITDVVKRFKVQVKILRKALCDYSSDFCVQSLRDKAGQR
jgi:septal ring factor EnvC (AmiA/AmiB activator)